MEGDWKGPRAPRSIGSWERIWGIPSASQAELAQLDLANALYRATLYFAQVAAHVGAPMIIGHPARARWKPQAASSWGLPETRALARHPDVQTIALNQCAYGVDARNATALMLVHLPELAAALQLDPHRGKCARAQGHGVALGRSAGAMEFRVAHLEV